MTGIESTKWWHGGAFIRTDVQKGESASAIKFRSQMVFLGCPSGAITLLCALG